MVESTGLSHRRPTHASVNKSTGFLPSMACALKPVAAAGTVETETADEAVPLPAPFTPRTFTL